MDSAQIVTLLAKNAYVLREDIDLMEAGVIKVQAIGADVTTDHASRLKGNLGRLREILDWYVEMDGR